MREYDAFGHTCGAGGIEKHRRLVGRRHNGVKRAAVEKAVEAFSAVLAEAHNRQVGGAVVAARGVAENKLGAGILQDEMDRLSGKLEVHRHRDEARAHDAVVGGKIFGAVGRQDCDTVAACQAALSQGARHSHRHTVQLRVAVLARRLLAAEINNSGLAEIAVAPDQIAEIGERRHQAFGGGGGAVK